MAPHCGSPTNVRSNSPAVPSHVCFGGSRTNARNYMSVVRSRVRFTCSHVSALVFLWFKFSPWCICVTSPNGTLTIRRSTEENLTMPVLFEAVGSCLITLLVGFSRTPCPRPPAPDSNIRLCPCPLDHWRLGLQPSPTIKRFSDMSARLTTLVATLLCEICANVEHSVNLSCLRNNLSVSANGW